MGNLYKSQAITIKYDAKKLHCKAMCHESYNVQNLAQNISLNHANSRYKVKTIINWYFYLLQHTVVAVPLSGVAKL